MTIGGLNRRLEEKAAGSRWFAPRAERPSGGLKPPTDNQIYTAVIKQTERWWIGWIEELPGVNCQEATREALLESLRVTLQEAIEFNRQETLQAAGDSFEETQVAV